jgi:DNA-binding IscR family transcriptional regulator
VTLLNVYEVIEGPLEPDTCLLGRSECLEGECVLGDVIKAANDLSRQRLAGTTLADLATERRQRQRSRDVGGS